MYGLSVNRLLRGSLEDALAALGKKARDDGGFADGTAGRASDSESSALALAAFETARFFGLAVPAVADRIADWFPAVDDDPDATEAATAAAIFSRFFVGRDVKKIPAVQAAADRLKQADMIAEPWACFWTSYALFQWGGTHWKDWSKRLATIAGSR